MIEKIVPFKIDRIVSAFLSGETHEILADFDERVLLKHVWGIWYADKEPITVTIPRTRGDEPLSKNILNGFNTEYTPKPYV